MTTEKDTAGPAFPEIGERGKAAGGEGISVRDYFAARAPLYPFPLPYIEPNKEVDSIMQIASIISAWNFAYADTMIAERSK